MLGRVMSATLWEVCVYQLFQTTGRSVCSKKVVEDFWNVHCSCGMVEGIVVDSNMNGFSTFFGSLFPVLVYYLEVGDVSSGVIVGNAVFVNCTGYRTTVFLYPIFQTSAGFSYVRKFAVFLWAKLFVGFVLF